jgi:hypothetical protein
VWFRAALSELTVPRDRVCRKHKYGRACFGTPECGCNVEIMDFGGGFSVVLRSVDSKI